MHVHGIVQMEPPWREGRAVAFPIWPGRAVSLGLWVKIEHEHEDDEAFADDLWLAPHLLPQIELDVIASWEDPDAEAKDMEELVAAELWWAIGEGSPVDHLHLPPEDLWDIDDFEFVGYRELPEAGSKAGFTGADGGPGEPTEQHLPLDPGVPQS